MVERPQAGHRPPESTSLPLEGRRPRRGLLLPGLELHPARVSTHGGTCYTVPPAWQGTARKLPALLSGTTAGQEKAQGLQTERLADSSLQPSERCCANATL